MVLAPLVLLAARILSIGAVSPFSSGGRDGRFFTSHLFSLGATVLLLPAALALARLVRGSARPAGSVGAAIVTLGVVGSAGVFALDFASIELARVGDPRAMQAVLEEILANPGVRLLSTLEAGIPTGLLVLSWALWRARTAQWPPALAIAAGAMLSNPSLPAALGVAGGLLLLAGFTTIAAPLLRVHPSRSSAETR